MALHCGAFLFGFTKSISVQLQGSDTDILEAYSEINDVIGLLREIRTDSEKNSQLSIDTVKSLFSAVL